MLENYEKLSNGVIKQICYSPFSYNESYVKTRYDSYNELTNYMSYLRYGFIVGSINRDPKSILDVGYGNGSFLKVCSKTVPKCYGYDVSDYPIPESCFKIDTLTLPVDVITFFDSLEHFDDISIVNSLKCNYICISVPECHYISDEWFMNWKHRRPDEHLWHFNLESLNNFMNECGFSLVTYSNIEDIIRTPSSEYSNILTAIFKNKKC